MFKLGEMNFWLILGEITFIFLFLFFILFIISGFHEKEPRVIRRSSLILFILILINGIFFLLYSPLKEIVFFLVFFGAVLFILVMILTPKPDSTQIIKKNPERIDERDTIFARFDYQPGSHKYSDYYRRKSELKKIDESIHKLPDILTQPHLERVPVSFSLASSEFDYLENLVSLVEGKTNTKILNQSAEKNTKMIKKILKYLGADLSGICMLDPSFCYSHVGRGPEKYGKEIKIEHKFAVVFAVEMDFLMIRRAPWAPVVVETAKKYVKAAEISIIAAGFIRSLGYPARAHIAGSNYQALLPPLGWMAGLGEMGRLGILMTPQYGPRVRLGLITTDLPLVVDKPIVFGVQDFCRKCKKCALNCPAQAISNKPEEEVNGVLRWVIKREECYRFWRKVGTDCAACIYVCPYAKPNNLFHNLIRVLSTLSHWAQTILVWGDDLFYGKRPSKKKFDKDIFN